MWQKDGVEVAIGPWDCSLGQHPEERLYCQPLSPDSCCELIHGDHLECYVEKEEEPDRQKVIIVVDEVDDEDIVVEDAIPKIAG